MLESGAPHELSLNTIFSAVRSVGSIVIPRNLPKSVSSTNPAICAGLRKPTAIRPLSFPTSPRAPYHPTLRKT